MKNVFFFAVLAILPTASIAADSHIGPESEAKEPPPKKKRSVRKLAANEIEIPANLVSPFTALQRARSRYSHMDNSDYKNLRTRTHGDKSVLYFDGKKNGQDYTYIVVPKETPKGQQEADGSYLYAIPTSRLSLIVNELGLDDAYTPNVSAIRNALLEKEKSSSGLNLTERSVLAELSNARAFDMFPSDITAMKKGFKELITHTPKYGVMVDDELIEFRGTLRGNSEPLDFKLLNSVTK